MRAACSNIKLGGKRFSAVNDVVVKRSIYSLGSTATIKLPVTARLHHRDTPPAMVMTAQEINIGDPVEIYLGYNGRLKLEFRGYVKALNLTTPLEVICEDEYYTTQNRTITTSGTTTLAALLSKCGLKIGFAEELKLKNFAVKNKSVSAVLGMLRTTYGLSVFFDFKGNVYACRPERVVGEEVKYILRHNVINDDKLQYLNNVDAKISITAVCFKRDGTKVEAKKGVDGGIEKTLYYYGVDSVKELAMLVEQELKRYKSNGYDGSIVTFLEPFAAPGMVAVLTDKVYLERSGRYYVESVETRLGMSGCTRTIELGGMYGE